jgi:tetratricopeptide (TPR) repeat protein
LYLPVLVGCAFAAYLALRVADPLAGRRGARLFYALFPVLLVAAGTTGYAVPRYHLLLGEHFLKSQQFAPAIGHLERARAQATRSGVRGVLVRRAVSSWGGEAELDTALGLAYAQTRQCDRARPLLDKVIDRARESRAAARLGYALFLYAACEMQAGRPDSAKKALTEALLIDGKYKSRARARASMAPLVDSLFGSEL